MRASSAPMRTRSRGRRPWLAVAVFALLAVVALAPARAAWEQGPGVGQQARAQAGDAQTWFGPYPYGMPGPSYQAAYGATDFMDLFVEGAAWSEGLGGLGVFQFYFGWVLAAEPQELAAAVGFLDAHSIAIAVEAPALELQPTCGAGAEGFVEDPVQITVDVLDAIAAAGGSVSWLVMQEPYTFAGPAYGGAGACSWNPAQVAAHVSDYIDGVRAEYPGAAFGTVESDHVSPGELAAFADAYAVALGEPLAFFHLDVDWQYRSDWPQLALETEALIEARGIAFGMIYNGLGGDSSDGDWVGHATEHFHQYEDQWGGTPVQAIFQSWHLHPQHLLPESDATAMTSLLRGYRQPRTALSVSVGPNSGNSRTATVAATNGNGTPLAGAPVTVRYRPADGPGVEAVYAVSGTVPAGAARAFLGFRVNIECNCGSGDSHFSFYEASFKQAPSYSERVPDGSFQSGQGAWYPWFEAQYRGASGLEPNQVRVDATAAQGAGLNSPVTTGTLTPGQAFTASFRAKVDPRSIGSGYFSVVFVSSTWAEVSRVRIPIEPAWVSAAGTTGAGGSVAIGLGGLPPARLEVTAVSGTAFAPTVQTGAATPVITGFDPAAIVEGSAEKVVRVLGTGFNHDSVGQWNGLARPTTVVSASELRLTLTAQDLADDGSGALGVSTPPSGGGSDSQAFTVAPRLISVNGGATVSEGTSYTLNLGASYPGEAIDRWRIDWGDGQVQTVDGDPASVTHTYADGPADRTVTAEARDGGIYYPANGSVAVAVQDAAPSITVSGGATVAEGSSYALSFSRTDPGQDTVAAWQVDWGDGSPLQALPAAASGASHTYADGPATPAIVVSLTDEDGTHAAAAKTVAVTNVAPQVTIDGAATVFTGAAYTLDLSTTDPGGDAVSAWQVNWGDGPPQTVSGNPASVTHVYTSAPTTHQVVATAVDEDGSFASNQVTVTVYNVAPPLTIGGPSTVDEGSSYMLALASGATYVTSWMIDWGDGSAPQQVSGDPSSAAHVYAGGPASYTVTASATDGVSSWQANSLTVSVQDVAPSVTVSGNSSVGEGSTYTLGFSATDPGNDTVTGWRVDWGDGSAASLLPAGATSAQHVFAHGPESHHIAVTVLQGAASFAAAPHTVQVLDVAPAVSVSGAAGVAEASSYTLALSASDPGQDPFTSWLVDWGDGTVEPVSGNPSSVTHVYGDGPAAFMVSASVFQGADEFPAGTVAVSVSDAPPAIALTGPASLREQHPYTLGLSSSDAGEDTVTGWSVDWGDGSAVETFATDDTRANHVYASGGVTRTITVTVTDEDGGHVATRQVAVLGPPALGASGPATVDEGAPYQLSLSVAPQDITGWQIDWGDGSATEVLPAAATTAEHVYADGPASHTVVVHGGDGFGTWLAGSIAVSVLDVAPALTVTGAATGTAGQPYTLSLAWSDPGDDEVTGWTLDWGDGSAPEQVPGLAGSAMHTFAASGSFTVTATAHQDGDAWQAEPVGVQVGVAPPGRHQLTTLAAGGELLFAGRNAANQLWARETAGGSFGPWELIGAGVASRPEAVRSGDSDFVFFRDERGGLGYVSRTAGGAWSGTSLGGTFAGEPAVAVDGDGDVLVAVRNSAGQIWVRRLSGGTWLGWTPVDGALAASPALARHGADVYLVGVSLADQVWARRWASASDSWAPWEALGGQVRPGLAAMETPTGNLALFGVSFSGQPWYREHDGSTWGPWIALSGAVETPIAVSRAGDALLIAGVNVVRNLWLRAADAGGWGSWTGGDGYLGTDVELGAAGGRAWAFALSPDGAAWFREWDGSGWGPWTNLGGTLAIEGPP